MDLSRRNFLTYVRNKVAVGVLCSELLTDALTTLDFVEQDPEEFIGFHVTEAVIEDDLYGKIGSMDWRGVYGSFGA